MFAHIRSGPIFFLVCQTQHTSITQNNGSTLIIATDTHSFDMPEETQKKPFIPIYSPIRFSTKCPRNPYASKVATGIRGAAEARTTSEQAIRRKPVPPPNQPIHYPTAGIPQIQHRSQSRPSTAAPKLSLTIPRKPVPQQRSGTSKQSNGVMGTSGRIATTATGKKGGSSDHGGCCLMM